MKKVVPIVILLLIVIASVLVGINFFTSGYVENYMVNNEILDRKDEQVVSLFNRANGSIEDSEFHHFVITLSGIDWKISDINFSKISSVDNTLITIETWGYDILAKIDQDTYDSQIDHLLKKIAKKNKHAFIRFNPEMEVPSGMHPWENNPKLYIAAFQKFSSRAKKINPDFSIVFPPAGYAGAMENFPGHTFIDAVSITLKSKSEAKLSYYGDLDPYEELRLKLHRMRFTNGPVMILSSDNFDKKLFKNHWLDSIAKTINDHPIIYSKEHSNSASSILPNLSESPLKIGLYDPLKELVKEDGITTEHIFIDFTQLRENAFIKLIEDVISRDHEVILTFEPWINELHRDEHLIENILAGKYDQDFEKLFLYLSNLETTVYLRFMHEMEIPIKRYAWQSQDPLAYIKAYRYFMTFPGSDAKNIRKVWGPAGDRGSIDFWPGNDVVDLISIAIYGLPDKNITDPNQQESFGTILNRKIWRMRHVDKPIFITEFGVKGNEEFQNKWLLNAAESIKKTPSVIGVNYFNMHDTPEAWGEINPPVWSINKNSLSLFLEAVK